MKATSAGHYQRLLGDFGGLDCTSDPAGVASNRFVRLDNLWRDYRAGDGNAIETFPGFRRLRKYEGAIHGIWCWRTSSGEYLVIHEGTRLWVQDMSDTNQTALPADGESVGGHTVFLADSASCAFAWEDSLYLLDGEYYYVLKQTDTGFTLKIVENIYNPVTYLDGERYEQRNLLSDYTVARYHIGVPTFDGYATPVLTYSVVDPVAHTCEVTGFDRSYPVPKIYVPGEVKIGAETYRVIRIAWKAFYQDEELIALHVANGVEEVGASACEGCTNLVTLTLPDSVRVVSKSAFRDCPLQKTVLGASLAEIAESAFTSTAEANSIVYHGAAENYQAITVGSGNTGLSDATVQYVNVYPVQIAYLRLYEPVSSITGISLGGVTLPSSCYTSIFNGYISGVIIDGGDTYNLMGGVIDITCRLDNKAYLEEPGKEKFVMARWGYILVAIAHCTSACVWDDRVFFYGNPDLPNMIFYASRDLTGHINPCYVGEMNYFQNGGGRVPNSALLPTSSYLAVIKAEPCGNGTVSFYCGQDTGNHLLPRIYVRTDAVAGRGCRGGALDFMDDPVYLSDEGLEALGREALNRERSLMHRSTLIDAALAAKDPTTAMCAEWEGYLVLLYPDGEAYLADGRRTCTTARGVEYEWYHLCGIGSYTDDLTVYRYAGGYPDDTPTVITYGGQEVTLLLHPDADALPFGADYDGYPAVYERILSGVDAEGNDVYFTLEEEGAESRFYLLSKTEERTGGTFASPTALLSAGGKLFFGCADGSLCVVNTDRRGVMNTVQSADYSAAEYAAFWGQTINPEWYTYAGHRIVSGFITSMDDCGVPNYTKKTVRCSTVAEMKAGLGCDIVFEVRINHGTYPMECDSVSFGGGGMDFTALDYGRFVFGTAESNTAVLQEKTKRWVRKQYRVWSDGFIRPFGMYRLAYTWKVEGKVKNK